MMNNMNHAAKDLPVFSKRPVRGVVLLFLCLMGAAQVACRQSTPPEPKNIMVTLAGQANYMMMDWQEGLRIVVWDDFLMGSFQSSNAVSTGDPFFRQEGGARAADGRAYEYIVETSDGLSGTMVIDGLTYDLSQGGLFLISNDADPARVQQLDMDLSDFPPTEAAAQSMIDEFPEVAAFVTGAR